MYACLHVYVCMYACLPDRPYVRMYVRNVRPEHNGQCCCGVWPISSRPRAVGSGRLVCCSCVVLLCCCVVVVLLCCCWAVGLLCCVVVLCCVVSCRVVSSCVVSCRVVLCCVVLSCVVLCCVVVP